MIEKRSPAACDGRAVKANSIIQSAQYSAPAFQSQHDDQPRKSGGWASRQKGNRAARDMLVVRTDRREPLVIVPLALGVEIAAAAERSKGGDA